MRHSGRSKTASLLSLLLSVMTVSFRTYLPASRLLRGTATKETDPTPAIPHKLFFLYHSTFDETPKVYQDNVQNTIDTYRGFWRDPSAPARYMTDRDCQEAIQKAYPPLVPHFDNETIGMYKSDICRVAILFLEGGYYFDIDLLVVKPINLRYDTVFSTVHSPESSGGPESFFQAFLASSPGNRILKEAFSFMLSYYEGTYKLKGWMGTKTLFDAYNAVRANDRSGNVQLLEEGTLVDQKLAELYPNATRQNGKGCCCDYVAHDPDEPAIYFYSRFPVPGDLSTTCVVTQ